MYYLYFSFSFILAIILLFSSRKQSAPYWWPALVFIAPVTAPYFINKISKEDGTFWSFVFFLSLSLVCGVEFYLYKNYMKKNKYAHLPALTRQMILLSDEVKLSTIDLDNALVRLETLSKVESRIKEIKSTLDFIVDLRKLMSKNQMAIKKLIKHTKTHEVFFKKQNLLWVYNIQSFYNNPIVVKHHNSLYTYLNEFEELLKYTYTNFSYITEHKNSEHLQNYDEYYLKYRRAVDSHNRFNVKRINFQNHYLKDYPNIAAYLPGERKTDTFKLWN